MRMLNRLANATVRPNCRKNCPTSPRMKAMGRKTATLARLDAITASSISRAPRRAASAGGTSSSRWRVMFSVTTMALSTIRPMAMASPSSDRTLRENPAKYTGR